MYLHWIFYVLLALALVVFWLYLRIRQAGRIREYWVIESFPKDGQWYDASTILTLVQEKHPNAKWLDVHPSLEHLQKQGVLESRIIDENYPRTRQPVSDPFGQWRWLGT
jgi:hypothetical protein